MNISHSRLTRWIRVCNIEKIKKQGAKISTIIHKMNFFPLELFFSFVFQCVRPDASIRSMLFFLARVFLVRVFSSLFRFVYHYYVMKVNLINFFNNHCLSIDH